MHIKPLNLYISMYFLLCAIIYFSNRGQLLCLQINLIKKLVIGKNNDQRIKSILNLLWKINWTAVYIVCNQHRKWPTWSLKNQYFQELRHKMVSIHKILALEPIFLIHLINFFNNFIEIVQFWRLNFHKPLQNRLNKRHLVTPYIKCYYFCNFFEEL